MADPEVQQNGQKWNRNSTVGAIKFNLLHQILKAEITPGMKASKLQFKGSPVQLICCFGINLFSDRMVSQPTRSEFTFWWNLKRCSLKHLKLKRKIWQEIS